MTRSYSKNLKAMYVRAVSCASRPPVELPSVAAGPMIKLIQMTHRTTAANRMEPVLTPTSPA